MIRLLAALYVKAIYNI